MKILKVLLGKGKEWWVKGALWMEDSVGESYLTFSLQAIHLIEFNTHLLSTNSVYAALGVVCYVVFIGVITRGAMPTPVYSDLLLCLCQFPALSQVHFHPLSICARRLQSILDMGTKWCGSWGPPLEPKLWVGIQTCLITPVTEEPPGRAHELKEEEVKHSLSQKQRLGNQKGEIVWAHFCLLALVWVRRAVRWDGVKRKKREGGYR